MDADPDKPIRLYPGGFGPAVGIEQAACADVILIGPLLHQTHTGKPAQKAGFSRRLTEIAARGWIPHGLHRRAATRHSVTT